MLVCWSPSTHCLLRADGFRRELHSFLPVWPILCTLPFRLAKIQKLIERFTSQLMLFCVPKSNCVFFFLKTNRKRLYKSSSIHGAPAKVPFKGTIQLQKNRFFGSSSVHFEHFGSYWRWCLNVPGFRNGLCKGPSEIWTKVKLESRRFVSLVISCAIGFVYFDSNYCNAS